MSKPTVCKLGAQRQRNEGGGAAFQEFEDNRTLAVLQVTPTPSDFPELVQNVSGVQDIINAFEPTIPIELDRGNGEMVGEEFQITALKDFSPSVFIEKIPLLKELKIKSEMGGGKSMKNIINTNPKLKAALDNPEAKEQLVQALKLLKKMIQVKKQPRNYA